MTEILNFERGIEPGSSSYETVPMDSNIPFFRVQDILNVESPIFINKILSKNKIVKKNEILVSFDGSVGKIGYGIEGAYSSGMQKITSKFNDFSAALIYAIFNSRKIQIELGKTSGTTIAHAGKLINKLQIPYNLSLFCEVQNDLAILFDSMLSNKLEIANLKKIQHLLLKRLSSIQQ